MNSFAMMFAIEVLVAELIFLKNLKKRNYFLLRILLVFVAISCYALFVPFNRIADNIFLSSLISFFRYFSVFVLSVIAYKFCYNEKILTIFTCCALGYIIQNISNRIFNVLDFYIPLFDEIQPALLKDVIKALIYFTIPYGCAFIFFKDYAYRNLGDVRLNILSIIAVICSMCFTRVFDFMNKNLIEVKVAELFLSLSSGLTILMLQNAFYKDLEQQKIISITNNVLREKTKEFELWKNSINTINIKVHDLKKMLSYVKDNVSNEYSQEIQNAINIYESKLSTGNEILDNLIYLKNVICTNNDIIFNYVIDGEAIKFMINEDIYALLTNIIDNAIEASLKIEEKEKRIIHLSITKNNGSTILLIENYYAGNLVVENNKILTSKSDKEYHGFGLLSIQQIAEKYGAVIQINTSNNIFSLQIAF